jgi:hypothetical protein
MRTSEARASETLLTVTPPGFRAEADAKDVRLSHGAKSWTLRPIWAGEGLPADVRRAIAEHLPAPEGLVPVLVARRMTSGAREILDEHLTPWADTSGRAQIIVPGELYIIRLDPMPTDAGRPFRWSAATQAVAEVLLTRRARGGAATSAPVGRVASIAQATGLSIPGAARVLRQFDEQHYTQKSGAQRGSTAVRELRDPSRMLSDWAGQYIVGGAEPAAEFHVPWREHDESVSFLTTSLEGQRWALTGAAAADEYSPYLTSIPTADVYVSADERSDVRRRLVSGGAKEVERGGRIRVFTGPEYLFGLSDDRQGLPIASSIRVYGDLLRQRGRFAEAAEYLREGTIGF